MITNRTTTYDDGSQKFDTYESGLIDASRFVPAAGSSAVGSETSFFYIQLSSFEGDVFVFPVGKAVEFSTGERVFDFTREDVLRQRVEVDQGVDVINNQFFQPTPGDYGALFDGVAPFVAPRPIPSIFDDFNQVPSDPVPDPGSFQARQLPADVAALLPTRPVFGDDFLGRSDFLAFDTPGLHPWSARVSSYDETGLLESRFTLTDENIEIREVYDDAGILRQFLESDLHPIDLPAPACATFGVQCLPADGTTHGAKEWRNRLIEQDANGDLALIITEFDDLDIDALIFIGSVQYQRQEFDGNDSEDWLYRFTDYGPDGATVTTYDVGDVFPEELLFDPPSVVDVPPSDPPNPPDDPLPF
ncbi:MAG: hypothetical protein AAF557_27140 [Pseudomonadota bacterium]